MWGIVNDAEIVTAWRFGGRNNNLNKKTKRLVEIPYLFYCVTLFHKLLSFACFSDDAMCETMFATAAAMLIRKDHVPQVTHLAITC